MFKQEEKKKEDRGFLRTGLVLSGLFLLMLLFLFLNIRIGSVPISLKDCLQGLMGKGLPESMQRILWEIRLPRAMAALFLGASLALSGYLLQTFFHNPIAGPFILGISSGAKLTVALSMIFLLKSLGRVSSFFMISAAFLGAMLSMGFVLLLSNWVPRMSQLIIAGVMIGYICTAITDFVVTFAEDQDIVNLHNWSKGSFSGMSLEHVGIIAVLSLLTALGCIFLSKPISAFQLGESYAKNLGVNVGRLKILILLLSSVLSALVVAFAGPISFVGVAVPQIARAMLKSTKPLRMIPACFLGGAVCCLGCDLIARTVFSPTELSISTVTAVFLAPVVILVLLRRQKEQ